MADQSLYQKQADQIYNPQNDAEIQQEQAKYGSTMSALDTEQGSIEPAYQSAIRNLGDQTRANEGNINLLYSQRLGGQFSGLQGNDMGMMYSKANQQRADIETTRANKLANIASRRTAAEQTKETDINAINNKYIGQKAQYSASAYNDAVKQEQQAAQDEKKFQQQLQLEGMRESAAAARQTNSSANGYKVGQKKDNAGYTFSGPGGTPVSMFQYAQATGSSMLDLLKQSASQYDKNAYNDAIKMAQQGKGEADILDALSKKYSALF